MHSSAPCRRFSDQWLWLRRARPRHRSPTSTLSRFGTGNLSTLRDGPAKAGIDVRERLLAFHAKHYSANLMRLVIIGREPLDDLQRMVEEMFVAVEDKGLAPPEIEGEPYRREDLGRRLEVVPVKEAREVQLSWLLPAMQVR